MKNVISSLPMLPFIFRNLPTIGCRMCYSMVCILFHKRCYRKREHIRWSMPANGILHLRYGREPCSGAKGSILPWCCTMRTAMKLIGLLWELAKQNSAQFSPKSLKVKKKLCKLFRFPVRHRRETIMEHG